MTATRPIPPAPPADLVEKLRAAKVPVEALEEALEACRGCEDHDEEGDEELGWPKGFETDTESTMLGGMTAFNRSVLISTGKADWEHDVCADSKDIPGLIQAAYAPYVESGPRPGLVSKLSTKLFGGGGAKKTEKEGLPGVFPSSATLPADAEPSSRLSILASSFISSSHEGHKETLIVLPDFKAVLDVHATSSDAEEVVKRYLAPPIGRAGGLEEGSLKSWPLPYEAVILLCSHKKRDKRCHIAAPLLISQFHTHLERHGYTVDERGDDITDGPPIEEWEGGVEERELRLNETLKGVKKEKTVGLFRTSHVGGHKFAGTLFIYFPNGSVVFYGRVSPADVRLIVDRTVVAGKVIPEFLRGGLGLAGKEGERGVVEW